MPVPLPSRESVSYGKERDKMSIITIWRQIFSICVYSLYWDLNSSSHIFHTQRSTLQLHTYHSCTEQYSHLDHSIHCSADYFESKRNPHRQPAVFCPELNSDNRLNFLHLFRLLCFLRAISVAVPVYTQSLQSLWNYFRPEK